LRKAALLAGGAAILPNVSWTRRANAQTLPPLVGALHGRRLVSAGQLWDWQNQMVDFGPRRMSGGPGHLAYLAFLEEEFRRAGLTTFHDPTQRYPFWDADHRACRLSLVEPDGATNLEVMSYFPGSGNTRVLPGGALTAEVVDVGLGLPADFAAGIATGSLRGKIAFCRMPFTRSTEILGYPNYYNDDPDLTMSPGTPWNKWCLSIVAPQALLTPALAAEAGCAGMIMALEASRTCAIGQYVSFFLTEVRGDQAHGDPGMPILHVDYKTGQYLASRLSALGSTTTARMVLPSITRPNTGTDEVVAFLPGANGDPRDPSKGENVIIATHTDGPSAAEENGPLGMLAIAKYFAQIPRDKRRRSLVFCLATGHMTDAYTEDTTWFTAHHPEIMANTAATMTIEHLGQNSFTDDPVANTYTFDGFPEMGVSPVSQHPLLIQSVIANYQFENLTRAPVINGPSAGVSQAFFNAQKPSYAFYTGPNTLYQMDPKVCLDSMDAERMHHEVRTFVRILAAWEGMSKDELGTGTAV
jgi:hypothetical protein